MESGRAFDTVATLYDAQRSGYPEELFADLSAIAGMDQERASSKLGAARARLLMDWRLRVLKSPPPTQGLRSSKLPAVGLETRRAFALLSLHLKIGRLSPIVSAWSLLRSPGIGIVQTSDLGKPQTRLYRAAASRSLATRPDGRQNWFAAWSLRI
jgi:hypothetical protein